MSKFAVFDIDGTLIRWQLYHTVVDKLAKSGVLGDQAYQLIKDARMKWKKRDNPQSYKEYEQVIIDVFESSLANISTADFDKMALEVINEYKDQVYTYTRDLIKDLKAKNYFILAISGSHHELIGLLAENYGFDEYIGSEYMREGNRYNGKKFIASKDKEAVLKQIIKKHSLDIKDSFAVGDSEGDIPLLKIVDNPIAFNPNQGLLEVAKNNSWKIVVERKNVVYELSKKGGDYILN